MRILHLVEPAAPGLAGAVLRPHAHDAGVLACRATIERAGRFEHGVCLVGPTSAEQRARDLGLPVMDRVAPALGIPTLAWYGLEALVRERGRPDVVQCWSRTLVRLAALAFGNSAPCLAPPDEFPLPDPGRLRDRAALRRRLGMRPTGRVILLLADPPPVADARRFISLLGLLEATGHRCTGVVPAGARELIRARRFCRDAHLGSQLMQTDLPAWALAPACDCAVLHTAGDEPVIRDEPDWAPALAKAAALGAQLNGLPVVAPAGSGVGALLDEETRGRCIAESARAPDIASRLHPLLSRPELLASVSDRVRMLAGRAIDADRAVDGVVARWMQVARHGASALDPTAVERAAPAGTVA